MEGMGLGVIHSLCENQSPPPEEGDEAAQEGEEVYVGTISLNRGPPERLRIRLCQIWASAILPRYTRQGFAIEASRGGARVRGLGNWVSRRWWDFCGVGNVASNGVFLGSWDGGIG
ncbi:hypothetical protein TI39_contig10g00001 [Zymoseptoria brevis]|uniref:Uncharacterized protein n=1 Tax=Zymoseptoria brevis TaxID=1047168 RepID=A0A0F4GYV8_9PEZI|nr:hypothetical protein TI39_contig10g00001 [Zymoseptoria brevis]